MAVWSNQAVTQFITLYRSHPCLWQLKSPDYSNRNKKNKAYNELVQYCKSIGFDQANRDSVTKKIQSLRGAFRKELKKVLHSLEVDNEDDQYKPGLWYFDQLLFTKDQDLPNSDNTDNEEESNSLPNVDNDEEPCWSEVKNIATVNIPCAYPDTSTSAPTQSYGASTSRIIHNESENDSEQAMPTSWSQKINRGEKRKLDQIGNVNLTSGIALSDITETDAIGITVSRKLQRMNMMQAMYAESIINAVLRKGVMNKLTVDTDICENQCSKNFFG